MFSVLQVELVVAAGGASRLTIPKRDSSGVCSVASAGFNVHGACERRAGVRCPQGAKTLVALWRSSRQARMVAIVFANTIGAADFPKLTSLVREYDPDQQQLHNEHQLPNVGFL